MHGPIKLKSPSNTSKWQMGFNSAFKGLIIKFLGSLLSSKVILGLLGELVGHLGWQQRAKKDKKKNE